MPKNYYLPYDDGGRAELLEHLAVRLPVHAATLGLTESDINLLKADAAAFRYTLTALSVVQANAKLWTAYKNQQRDGGTGDTAYPITANLPAAAPAVPHGIIPRLTNLVARIKSAVKYTEGIGQDLNIVGSALAINEGDAKPILDIAKKAGHPQILWSKGDADALEIWVDRNDDKGFGLFTIANSTRVPDNATLPATGATWRYKAIYRVKDEQIGEWSDVVTIAVGG